MSDLKSMGLYRDVERIEADLAASGIGAAEPLRVDDLTPFDQYHYEGTAAVDDAIAALDISESATILDVGSGLGGPARYLADRTGCEVVALELQQDLDHTGRMLTERCGLSERVQHVQGDVLTGIAEPEAFSGLVSMLCFLHIPDRERLFENCARALKQGGQLFIDDYFAAEPLTAADWAALSQQVYCDYLPDQATYVADLERAGFVDIEVQDKSDEWSAYVADRFEQFQSRRSELDHRYGPATVRGLDEFYGAVAALFGTGRLGGLRVVARVDKAT